MTHVAQLLASGHQAEALDGLQGLAIIVGIGLVVVLAITAWVIVLVIKAGRNRKKPTVAPPSDPPRARVIDDKR